jgi:hypothetical protein
MARRTASSQSEHDRVIEAWAQIAARRFSGDVQVGTNPGDLRRIQVGPDDDARFPDILVWRAEAGDGRDGTAELVAEIETADTLAVNEVSEWAAYGRLMVPFHLIVPVGSEEQAIRLLKKRSVRVSQLWSYEIVGGEVIFSQYLELPALSGARVVRRD